MTENLLGMYAFLLTTLLRLMCNNCFLIRRNVVSCHHTNKKGHTTSIRPNFYYTMQWGKNISVSFSEKSGKLLNVYQIIQIEWKVQRKLKTI